tara:strand:+ start:408 stop:797 length:390 start_codon:yes stop_codon:yes gene_type:complete
MKTIRINNPLIIDIYEEKQKTKNVIITIYDRFQSEHNNLQKKESLEKLDGYAYIENKFKLWEGRYIRYIDLSNPLEIVLKVGGFLVNDNGYTVTLRKDNKIFKVDKRNKLFFMIMMQEDVLRCKLHRLK